MSNLPRLLIIDDLFGRSLPDRRNEERANLCGQYLIEDITGDEVGRGTPQRIKRPIAQAVFCRGQTPARASIGDLVENDLTGTLAMVREGWRQWPRWALVLLDLCFYTGAVTESSQQRMAGMPEGRESDDDPAHYFGLRLLKAIHDEFPDLPVIILSSMPREDVSRVFSEQGALAFLSRSEGRGPEILRDYISRHGLIPDEAGEIVGHSLSLLLSLRLARRVAAQRRNVLLRGERGTGKELLARYVIRHSPHESGHPLVVVDSGTLNAQLYASELFGHRRGAFTGAERDRTGRILQADGGSLFLDEIGNMPADVQTGLLRVLEQRVVTPLGALEGQRVDVRFVSATNEDLESRAATGTFRQDLLDRLREGGTVFLRPLRERREDLDSLVERLVREAEEAIPGTMTRQIEPEALQVLHSCSWPGNIRELRSCIFNSVANYPDVEHLVPVHLQLGEDKQSRNARPMASAIPSNLPADLEAFIGWLRKFSFLDVPPRELAGKLPVLQEAYARLLAHLLKAAIEATRRPTADHPEGETLIHPAIKLLTGDKSISASKAADIVKRLFNVCPEIEGSLLSDPILKDVFEKALRLRPRKPSPGKKGSN